MLRTDKVRNDIEYDVNLKSEMQIAHMHEKVDGIYSSLMVRLDRMEKRMPDPPKAGTRWASRLRADSSGRG